LQYKCSIDFSYHSLSYVFIIFYSSYVPSWLTHPQNRPATGHDLRGAAPSANAGDIFVLAINSAYGEMRIRPDFQTVFEPIKNSRRS